MEGVVRLFVETSEKTEAERVAGLVVTAIGELATLREEKVTKYWKIPEYFELLMVWSVANGDGWCEKVAGALGTGWDTRATEAIWNPGEGHSFFVQEVRWAQVELLS